MHPESPSIYFDNDWLKTSQLDTKFLDHAMLFGQGVFEELRCYVSESGINIFKANEHFKRLIEAAKSANIRCDYSVADLLNITHQVLERNNLGNAHIRALLYEDADKGKLMVSATKAASFSVIELDEINSTSVKATSESRQSSTAKTSLLVDDMGFVLGGECSNFFFVKDEILYTPVLNQDVFPGLMRDSIINCATILGYPVIEKAIQLDEINGSEAAFFSNGAYEMSFVSKLDNCTFTSDWRYTIANDLVLMFRQQVLKGDSSDYSII
ncbi:MAG: hypothetical protein GY816_01185 [Cytophagales bacterium]|nr:hypothetical protein [Cytophagales bacterium]